MWISGPSTLIKAAACAVNLLVPGTPALSAMIEDPKLVDFTDDCLHGGRRSAGAIQSNHIHDLLLIRIESSPDLTGSKHDVGWADWRVVV